MKLLSKSHASSGKAHAFIFCSSYVVAGIITSYVSDEFIYHLFGRYPDAGIKLLSLIGVALYTVIVGLFYALRLQKHLRSLPITVLWGIGLACASLIIQVLFPYCVALLLF